MKIALSSILASLLILPGCLDTGEDAGGPIVEDPSGESGTTDKISLNGLALHKDALERLSAAPLAGATAEGLSASAEGRAMLDYAARCALPQGTAVTVGGEVYPGLLGLAPEWLEQECEGACQRWVSACLLAHANLLGDSIPISLRGPHPALEPSDYALQNFTVREAGFYGNVFSGDQALYGCIGDGMFDGDPTDASVADQQSIQEDYLAGRLCGLGACGVENTGICWMPQPATGACGFDAGALGGYSECSVGALYGDLYQEVVTVHLLD